MLQRKQKKNKKTQQKTTTLEWRRGEKRGNEN